MKNLLFASDHAGVAMKSLLMAEATKMGWNPIDLGTNGIESVDYPDFGHAMAEAIKQNKAEYGILICGSGIGISIAANRHSHIRAALCHSGETAKLSRQHNNANVLALGARIVDDETAKSAMQAFLTTDFEGGRHASRVAKLG